MTPEGSEEHRQWRTQDSCECPSIMRGVLVLGLGLLVLALAACTGGAETASTPTPSATSTVNVTGREPVAWKLTDGQPAPSATAVEVEAAWRACTGGVQPDDPQPVITYGADNITVTIWAIPPKGRNHTCPGNPSVRLTVSLTEPVGDRLVVQGSEVPY